MYKYLLSIIVPTRNRQKYCLSAIKQILSHGWDDVEICIQDNSEDNRLQDEIVLLNSDSISYNYHPGLLSFVDNFSEAISLAHGEYLCMIGDDDGVLPNIVKTVKYAKQQNLDAVIPGLNVIYYWPTDYPIVDNGGNGCLFIIPTSKGYKRVNTQASLNALVKNCGVNYLQYDLARVYHGIVRRDVFEKIKCETGHLFDGLTPDIYMATSLSLKCKRVVKTDFPVTISGICPTSGSTDSATGKHTGELKDAPHFRGHDSYEWDTLIPPFYSVETIWSESMLQALRNFKRLDLIQLFSISKFDSFCLKKYPQFSTIIREHANKHNCSLFLEETIDFSHGQGFCNRLRKKIKRGFRKTIRLFDIENVEEAEKKVCNIIVL